MAKACEPDDAELLIRVDCKLNAILPLDRADNDKRIGPRDFVPNIITSSKRPLKPVNPQPKMPRALRRRAVLHGREVEAAARVEFPRTIDETSVNRGFVATPAVVQDIGIAGKCR